MLSAKSLGVEKQIPLNPDMTYTKPTISTSGKKFSEVSNGFVVYNKYEAIFSGYLKMKDGVVNADETLLTLPFKPKYPNAYINGRVSGNPMTIYVDQYGNLKKQAPQTFEDGDLVFIVGSFSISNGGGGNS
ncbi:hypothetical protein [uncultured Faecalicoccus sp.]|uniref:hypothetical protein n=1 Tax=uncultured Faecalicoccus sp. TaxID=1971760 RepID=UPI0026215283|nr:hypothetical protein [uncultured Faecalicoccus sp.]